VLQDHPSVIVLLDMVIGRILHRGRMTRPTSSQMSIDTHVPGGTTQALSLPVWYMQFRFGITILLGHTKVHNVDGCATKLWSRHRPTCVSDGLTVGSFGARTTNQEVVRFDIAINQIFLMNGLHSRKLSTSMRTQGNELVDEWLLTICRAAMHTVLIENFRPHISNKSSKLGPRRSITRMLCNPSCPKWYI
jgi:hypothetical protein